MNIAICISTYKRPMGLEKLLDSVEKIFYPKEKLTVCIADNDPVKSEGHRFVENNKNRYSFKIVSSIEPNPGISHARNYSLTLAKQSAPECEYIAFTDDDAIVSGNWIDDMLDTATMYNADVVVGRIEPKYETIPPARIIETMALINGLGSKPTGTTIHDGNTGNLLCHKRIFDNLGYEPFDTALSLTGGEDSDFFERLNRNNYKIVQCSSSIVYEMYPQERLNDEWALNRFFRNGATYAYIVKKYHSSGAYWYATFKKTIRFAHDYMQYKINPSLINLCKLKNTLGFLNFVFKSKIFEEYGRS